MNNNSILRLATIFFSCLIVVITSHYLFAQNFFPCGVYNFDVSGYEYTFSSQEFQRIKDINASWVSSVSLLGQDGMIDSFSVLAGSIKKMTFERDSLAIVYNHYYPINPGDPDQILNNTILWAYISQNRYVANIDSAHIDSFVTHVNTRYHGSSGLGGILIAHQGEMDQSNRWPFIRHACTLIQNRFGDDVKSNVVHNIFHWRIGTTLQQFFHDVDSLDVYQHEQYPLRMFNQTTPPYTPVPYIGNDFQQKIDTLVISYQQTWEALKNSGNDYTRLEFIFQTHECYDANYNVYWRRPTEAEIWLQAFLALSREAKGVHSYVYRSHHYGGASYETGLIDSTTRLPNQPTYSYVADVYTHLDSLGPKLLPLTVLDAYTWNGTTRHKYIKTIANDSLEGSHRTIEVSLMDDPDLANTYDYFLLINRRCNRDNAGVWVNAYPQNIDVTLADSMPTGTYQIRDLYSNEHYLTSDNVFRQIKILAGRGRLFELKRLFVNATDILSDTVNICSSITVPSGKTLTISPNSTVKFYSSTELKVQGTLHADSVMFTAAVASANPGYWSRIYFYYANASSRIQHSIIEKANYGIFCNHASPTIDTNMVNLNNYGIYCQSSSSPYITENYITDNNSYGIYLTQTCNPYIRHNAVRYNGNNGVQCLNSSSPSLIGKSTSEQYGANEIIVNDDGDGVRAQTNSNPNIGTVFSGSLQGYNDIYNNSGKQVSNYTTGITVNANVNWWGIPNPGPALFYGSVRYKAPLSSPSPYAGPTWGSGKMMASPPVVEDNITNEVEKYLARGQMFEGEEQFEEAVKAYRYVVDNFSESEYRSFAFSRLMACRDKQGDITVEKDYVASLSQKGNSDEAGISALLWQPLIEARARNYQLALDLCDQLAKIYAGNDLARDAWFEKGSIQLYEMNNVETAQKTFEEFAQAYPNDPLVEHIGIILSSYIPAPKTLPKSLAQNNNQHDDFMIPEKFALAQNYPNPFNPETEIRFQLPEPTHVRLTIYNLLGQKIHTLIDKEQKAGYHAVHWDGHDENGTPVASGVYLYAISAGEFNEVKKMVLVR